MARPSQRVRIIPSRSRKATSCVSTKGPCVHCWKFYEISKPVLIKQSIHFHAHLTSSRLYHNCILPGRSITLSLRLLGAS